uniref:helix-turn-helix domain-containing protein n=1 Tax=uncultured Desulfovibrio sp. TaxID=167968 RepID=UPI0026F35FCD
KRGEPVPAPLPPLSGEARGGSLRAGLDQARDVLVRQAMEACGGDRRAAARCLGVGYSSLCRMLRSAGTARHLQSRQ